MNELAVIFDFKEEGWLSMDFCAEMLLTQLQQDPQLNVEAILPRYQRILTGIPWLGQKRPILAVDQTYNRFWVYPQTLKAIRNRFDFFHICDHSYAHLVHDLPAERTGVFCHDIDAFLSLVEPEKYPQSRRYNMTQRRVLTGLQKAAVVFYTTDQVRQQIEHYQLVDPKRLVQAPLGIAPEFTPVGEPVSLPALGAGPFVLSVSSNQARKRLDILIEVFAGLRAQYPELRLVRVGNDWPPKLQERIQQLGLADAIIRLHGLSRAQLAELYRRAAVTLVTSEAEGFGLPVIEALACGSPVVASAIPVLQEVGGNAVLYCPLEDIPHWVATIQDYLTNPEHYPSQTQRLQRAARYSWASHAQTIQQNYGRLCNR